MLGPRETAIFIALTDAYCEPEGAFTPVRETDAARFMNDLLGASPRVNRAGFRVILALLDLTPLVRGYRRRFRKLGNVERREFLHGLDKSRFVLLPIASRLLKTLTIMSYYGDPQVLGWTGYDADATVARGRDVRRAASASRAPMPSAVRPTGEDAYMDPSGRFVPSEVRVVHGATLKRDLTVTVDACVIGTGAGGAPVAKELAEAGLTVAMLEEGEHHTVDDYNGRPREMSVLLYRDAGQIATVGVPPILLPLGKSIGGSTHINSATCFRTPPAVLELWRERFGLEALTVGEMDAYLRRVERELNVVKTPASIAGKNAEVVKRGADRLGYAGDYVYRNVRGCVGSGICNFGCPTAAKQHVGVTYVPKAWEAGATTYSGTRAKRLLLDGNRVLGVEATVASGRRLIVKSKLTVLTAGAIHTPLFLRRQRMEDRSGQIGRNLSLHPATGVRALFQERIDMWHGVPQSYFIDQFADEGIMLEGAAGTPDWIATSLPYIGERHRRLMESCRNLSQFGLMVSDSSRGFVRELAGRPHIRYDLNRADTIAFKRGIEILCEIYWAAGAQRVYPPIAGLPELGPEGMQALRALDLEPGQLSLMAFHPLGTCRMGADPAASPVDVEGRLRGYEGLYIADGSIVPSSLGVNPQITIMALATRIAYGIVGKSPPVDEPEPEHIAAPRVSVAHL
jgi:choline dehydrogenase-like flavoprotein